MTQFHDTQYLDLIKTVLNRGFEKTDRTGTGTLSTFAQQMRFDLRDGTIPLLTTKKMFTRGVIHEILWYLQGDGNINYLKENNVTIWDEWADADGNLGPVYGVQWRNCPTYQLDTVASEAFGHDVWSVGYIDQISELINKLKTNPDDRRLLVSAWNVGQLSEMALPPCHYAFQCYTRKLTPFERAHLFGRIVNQAIMSVTPELVEQMDAANVPTHELSMMLNQRSCDVGLGVPFNIVQYSIILRMIAEVTNMVAGDFIWSGGDVHIYKNHVDQLTEQQTREPYPSPTLSFARKVESIDDFKYDDFIISGYQSHSRIIMDVAV